MKEEKPYISVVQQHCEVLWAKPHKTMGLERVSTFSCCLEMQIDDQVMSLNHPWV